MNNIKETYEISEEHLVEGKPIPIKLLTPDDLAGTVYYYEGFKFDPEIEDSKNDEEVNLSFSYEFFENPHNIEYQKCKEFEEHISMILIDILKDRAMKVIDDNADRTCDTEESVSE